MQPRRRTANVFLILALVFFGGVTFLQNYLWPPQTPPKKATPPDVVGLYAGAAAAVALHPDIDVPGKEAEERRQQFPSALGNLGSGLTTVALGIHAPDLAAA